MLNIDSIQNGIVIDHIKAGMGMELYKLLSLDELDCCVALIKNARSEKYGRKDIIKIEGNLSPDLEILGYLDPNITICIIKDGRIAEKKRLTLPKKLKNVIHCRNPRCICSIEGEIDHIFDLSENGRYRCRYCEQEFQQQRSAGGSR